MAVSIIFDIVLIGIVAAGAIIGIKKGLFLTVSKPVRFFLTLFLAFQLCNMFGTAVIQPLIEPPMTTKITEYLLQKCGGLTSIESAEELPTLLRIAAGLVGVDVTSITGENTEMFISELVNKLAVPAIHFVSVIVGFVILYFLLKLLLKLLFALLNSIAGVGFIGVMNRILGFVFNTAFAFIISWAVVAVFSYIISIPAVASTEWAAGFEGGFVYNFLKSMSPLDLLLSF